VIGRNRQGYGLINKKLSARTEKGMKNEKKE
jgi:hypothetical protein